MIDSTTPGPVGPRERRHHAHSDRRSISAPLLCDRGTLAARAIRWAVPWSRDTFPGLRAGIREILGRPTVAWATVQGWRAERSRMPAADALRLAGHIRARAEHGLGLAEELERYAEQRQAEPRRLTGFCAVDPLTRQDRRNRIGRQKRVDSLLHKPTDSG